MLVVSFDALLTELMEASPDALGLTVDARTDLALNQVLEPLKELSVHDLVALVTVLTKYTGLRDFKEEAACNKIRKSIRRGAHGSTTGIKNLPVTPSASISSRFRP